MRIDNVRWVFALLAIVLGSMATPRAAQAQIPSNGVFYGCMRTDRDQDEGKFVRLVSATEACKKNEIRISWNQQGAKGDPGMGATVATINPGGACGSVGGVQVTDGNGHSEYICDGAKGDKGDKGDNAQGVVGEGSDSAGPINIFSGDQANGNGNTIVTKKATGFRGYVAWANAAVRITNPNGPGVVSSVTCSIRQSTPSINGGAAEIVDMRPVTTLLPPVNGAVVYNVALVGDSPLPAPDGSDITTFSLVCGYNGQQLQTPPINVSVVSASIVVIGLNNVFQIPNN